MHPRPEDCRSSRSPSLAKGAGLFACGHLRFPAEGGAELGAALRPMSDIRLGDAEIRKLSFARLECVVLQNSTVVKLQVSAPAEQFKKQRQDRYVEN